MSSFLLRERGGLRLGKENVASQVNYTFPFAKLLLTKDELSICYPFRHKVIFQRGDITNIEIYSGAFSRGIRIKHQLGKSSPFIVFWSANPESLIQVFMTITGAVDPCTGRRGWRRISMIQPLSGDATSSPPSTPWSARECGANYVRPRTGKTSHNKFIMRRFPFRGHTPVR